VGLVLASFQALDYREESYQLYSQAHDKNSLRTSNKKEESSSKKKSNDFFKKLLEKTKGLLLDDFDENDSF
jgi:cell division protein FtsA